MQQALNRWRNGEPVLAETIAVHSPWRTEPDSHHCTARYVFSGPREAPRISAVVDGVEISLDDPQPLIPVEIPKPWGREIWYTGLEARGESSIGQAGASIPLGTYLALGSASTLKQLNPVLLKILDPRPEPVLGELYLEVHEEKQEVYVVTAVDRKAWPDGQGRIRYGINQARRQDFDSDHAFRTAFLDALRRYEQIRAQIDAGVRGLEAEEQEARLATVAFTDERSLEVGDVISVPTWVPHSLQQGVRVVEFQTPTYERFILSSSQQVLTQERWDSALAVERMHLEVPPAAPVEKLSHCLERIVQFDDFGVWRAEVGTEEPVTLPAGTPYALVFCVTGSTRLEGPVATLSVNAGEAAWIPAGSVGRPVTGEPGSLILLAAPGL